MNKVTSSEIWERLQNDFKEISSKDYPNQRVLGTFLLGKANFGNANESKDLDTITIILPTISNIVINGSYVNHSKYNKQGGRIECIDFRYLFDLITNANENYIEILFTEFSVPNPLYKKLLEKLKFGTNLTYEQREDRIRYWGNEEEVANLKNVFEQIFVQYLEFKSGIQEELFSSLTKTEEKALIYVLETIGEEGNISISCAIAESGISRPVFTSLFEKLDRYKGAEVKNQGVKGTYINFYDHVLSKFNIE
jgi:hypothetical protein